MKYEDTICAKVEEAIHEIITYQRTGVLAAPKLATLLKTIKDQAYAMEEGLRNRKKLMQTIPKLEEDYQTKKHVPKHTQGVNTLRNKAHYSREPAQLHHEVIIKNVTTNKIVYQQKGYAGVVSITEEITELLDKDGATHGTAQTFFFGHPFAMFFAFDQLKQSLTRKAIEIRDYIQPQPHKKTKK